MAYTTIKKPSDYFNTKLYDGTGSVANVTGVGFQPDFTWIKRRNDTRSHFVTDAVRGAGKQLKTNLTGAETSYSGYLNSFISDGFTLGTDGDSNDTGGTYASWNWLGANGTSANTDGSISSTVSANTTSGFSIVSYTGNSDASKTIGHGLGTAPSMIITKDRDDTRNWCVYHKSLGATKFLRFNNNVSGTSTGRWNDTEPTSSVFSVGDDAETGASFDYIAYCFAEKQGYSKFGSYTGNGNADGTFVYTGFKPAFVIVKSTNNAINWSMIDNKRDPDNAGTTAVLRPNTTDTEDDNTAYNVELLSNGFKNRNTNSSFNNPSYEYIYMAFAEQPLVGDNPATAR